MRPKQKFLSIRLDTMFGGHQTLHITTNTSSTPMWWQHHAVGMRLSCVRLEEVESKMNAAKYSELLEDNLIQSAREL